jgi:hypothetical protein
MHLDGRDDGHRHQYRLVAPTDATRWPLRFSQVARRHL